MRQAVSFNGETGKRTKNRKWRRKNGRREQEGERGGGGKKRKACDKVQRSGEILRRGELKCEREGEKKKREGEIIRGVRGCQHSSLSLSEAS